MTRLLKVLSLGELQTNCFLLQEGESRKLIVVDPAEAGPVITWCAESGFSVGCVLITHGHYDHIGGVSGITEKFDCPVAAGSLEREMLADPDANYSAFFGLPVSLEPDIFLEDGADFCSLRVLHTPGHTPGGISLAGCGFVLAGDTLFRESVGRSDLPGGDHRQLITSIRDKLFPLPETFIVYPGHGAQTTIGHEKMHNPFLE
ncbi:MAG: MBL fold metallo-hydrolase [Candidatus Wallbacteria bacterium]|nr:MBL fold metallo-hydrolase [Candidatus Wallbacteria bacterium]